MNHVGSILLLLRPRTGYDYIVIQVVCWVELLEQRKRSFNLPLSLGFLLLGSTQALKVHGMQRTLKPPNY